MLNGTEEGGSEYGIVYERGTSDEPEIIEPGGRAGLQPDVAYSEEFVILNLVKPTYPEFELSKRIAALITVVALITPEGGIGDAQIENVKVEPPGASSRGFELTALEAVRQWRIRLPLRYRQTEGCWLRIPIEFRPEDANFARSPMLAPR